MGLFGNLFEGPGSKVEKIIDMLVAEERERAQNFILKVKKDLSEGIEVSYSYPFGGAKVSMSDINKEWINFLTILRIFNKINADNRTLIEGEDFNGRDEDARIRIFDKKLSGYIFIDTYLDEYTNERYIEATWQNSYTAIEKIKQEFSKKSQ